MTTIEQAKEALTIIAELVDIQKRSHRFAARDQVEWMDKQLPQLARLMDGVVADMEYEEAQEAIDNQLAHNAHLEKSVEMGWSA